MSANAASHERVRPVASDGKYAAGSESIGRAVGCLAGCTGWSIGLFLWALASGHLAELWAHALGGFVASLALGLLLLTGLGAVERAAPRTRLPFFIGGLLAVMGMLVHMLNIWIAPAIEARGLAGSLAGAPVVYRVHPAVPWTLIVASLPAFAAALGRFRSEHRRASV